MIKLTDINKSYKVGKRQVHALKDINIEFANQEFVSILGPSGCGKTTLLNIIGGLDVYSSGELLIDGVDTTNYKASDWDIYRNTEVGFVFQNFNLINHLSVLKNVELSLTLSGISRSERKKRALEALGQVGLLDEVKKKPNQLSGGQQQRVALARAIVNNPRIILADEPTGALDSETSMQIMEILKEISKSKLVIMVTHNEELANLFSTRIIKLFDGKVINDNNPTTVHTEQSEAKIKKRKVTMSFFSAMVLSLKNLLTKYIRTTLTVLAGCIGIVGVGLVIAVSTGVKDYIGVVQKNLLANNPIVISSSTVTSSSSSNNNVTAFPDTDQVFISRPMTTYENLSAIDEEFISHIEQMPKEYYSVVTYNRSITMNLLTKTDDTYKKVYDYDFIEMSSNMSFVSSQYDVLAGKLPTTPYEVAIVIDKYNTVSASLLNYIGLEYDGVTSYSFDELMAIEFRAIYNNDYYVKVDDRYYTRTNYRDMYESSTHSIKVSGIVRVSEKADNPLYRSCILYSDTLTKALQENALKSDIVVEQQTYGINKNVVTGQEFTETPGISSVYSKEYQYERNLVNFGAVANVTTINIYATAFSDRVQIGDYVKSYEKYNTMQNISYRDYLKNFSDELATFIEILTKALIVFAGISLVVSSIMIAIITYVSVLERTKEIGVLRSVGARKIDVTRIFTAESVLIGFASGLMGIILAFALSKPINSLVVNIIKENTTLSYNLSTLNVVVFDWKYLILLLCGSMVITVIAGFVPSLIASRKSPIEALRSNL